MRYLLVFSLLIAPSISFTQSSFEGKIIYSLTGPGQNGRITIWFGKPGLKQEFTDTVDGDKIRNTFITNFDSGKSFALSIPNKVYTENLLFKRHIRKLPISKEIAGYVTTPTNLTSGGFSCGMSSFSSDVTYYPASNLYFELPEFYIGNSELIMVQGNKILLGIEYYTNDKPELDFEPGGDTLRKFREVYRVIAYKVIPEKIAAGLFVPPAEFTKKGGDLNDNEDSLTKSLDSIKMPRQTPVKKKRPPTKKKTSNKQNAARRKDD